MKHLKLLGLIIFLLSQTIFAEDNTKDASDNKFEFLLKQAYATYIPSEYTTQKSIFNYNMTRSGLNSNTFAYNPFNFSYTGELLKYEFNRSIFTANSMNYTYQSVYYYDPIITPLQLPKTTRSDTEFNIIYLNRHPNKHAFTYNFGGGIRNVNKIKMMDHDTRNIDYESLKSYGLQLSFRSTYSFANNLFINLNANVYKTFGNRNIDKINGYSYNGVQSYTSISYVHSNNNVTGTVYGKDVDLSIAYKFHKNFKFYLGYFLNSSLIGYQNMNDYNIHFASIRNGSNVTNYTNVYISNSKASYETIKYYYFGISLNF